MPKPASFRLAVPRSCSRPSAARWRRAVRLHAGRRRTDLNRIYRIDASRARSGRASTARRKAPSASRSASPRATGPASRNPPNTASSASRHEREGGVFRVDMRTGAMSVCYVFDERVVCTPPERGAIAAAAPQPAPEVTGTVRKTTP